MSKATCTWDNTTASRKITRTKRYNEESWQAGWHTPNTGIYSKQPCHLPEETGVQLLCAASYDMMQRPGHWPNKHRTNLRQHRPKWKEVCSTLHTKIEKPTSGSGRGQSHRYNQHCETNEMVLGRAYHQPQRRPMDLTCHHLETIWQETTTRETSQAVERRPGQIWSDMIWQRTAQDRVIWRRHAEAFAPAA